MTNNTTPVVDAVGHAHVMTDKTLSKGIAVVTGDGHGGHKKVGKGPKHGLLWVFSTVFLFYLIM